MKRSVETIYNYNKQNQMLNLLPFTRFATNNTRIQIINLTNKMTIQENKIVPQRYRNADFYSNLKSNR
jgi:hypothetical protein